MFVAGLLFFLSGGLGLGYELVWVHKAQQIVGSSQVALSTVLTSFFLGLALGSLFVGRYLRSSRWSPIFVYGLFEAAIGVFAIAFPFLFELVAEGYGALYPIFRDSAPGLFLLRFLLLFLFFLLPTFFMGGTLPLLLDGLVDRDRAPGPLTTFLYGLNILGAVCGVLVTGYLAIPELGMNATSLFAGIGNLTIATTAIPSSLIAVTSSEMSVNSVIDPPRTFVARVSYTRPNGDSNLISGPEHGVTQCAARVSLNRRSPL